MEMTRTLSALGLLAVATASQAQVAYSDTTTFSNSGYYSGVPTGGSSTYVDADDLTYSPSLAGLTVSKIVFSTANFNAAAISVRPTLAFWDSDGSAGAPGTFLGSVTFNPLSLSANGVQLWNYSPTTGFALPASGTIWAGISFDNLGGSTATAAQLGKVGQGLFDPPTVGSSTNGFFESDAAGPISVSNPAGGGYWFGSTGPVANFGWEIDVVPEPCSMLAMGIGLVALARKRRK